MCMQVCIASTSFSWWYLGLVWVLCSCCTNLRLPHGGANVSYNIYIPALHAVYLLFIFSFEFHLHTVLMYIYFPLFASTATPSPHTPPSHILYIR
jgi:hypothetical protein